jgi:hypothetical protein
MEWIIVEPFVKADISDLWIVDANSLIAVTTTGEAVRATSSGEVDYLAHCGHPLAAVRQVTNSLVTAVGSAGLVLTLEGNAAHHEIVDPAADLTGLANDGPEVFAVGRYDAKTGAVFCRPRDGAPWSQLPPVVGQVGLAAIQSISGGRYLIAGHRGYLAVLEKSSLRPIPMPTQHPLRALLAIAPDRWLIGGGGWAQEMPILLVGNEAGMKPLATAPGNRVVVGLAQDLHGHIWVAENRSDERGWSGAVSELRGDGLVTHCEFSGHLLRGIRCAEDVLIAYGKAGFIARAPVG